MRSGRLALMCVALFSVTPRAARAQDVQESTSQVAAEQESTHGSTTPSESVSETASESESESVSETASGSESESSLSLGEPFDPTANLAPGVADLRLAHPDDGIDDQFAAYASERVFSGTVYGAGTLLLHTELGIRFGITRDARARVDWGFAYSNTHVVGTLVETSGSTAYDATIERIEAQNPTLTFEWAPIIGVTRFAFGLGVSAPTAAGENIPNAEVPASAPEFDAANRTHQVMLAANGGLAPWRYRRERMGLFIPIGLYFPIDRMTIAIEGAAAISAPVIGAGPVPVTGDLQADVQLSGDILPELRMGMRFGISVLDIGASSSSMVGIPVSAGTIVQPSATGFVRMRVDPGFLVLSALADLGGYYGIGTAGGVWSLTLGGGAALP